MSISSISSNSFSMPASRTSETLSTSDQKKLEEILSKYDSSNMDENRTSQLKSELQSSGIKLGKGVGDKLASSGFDAEALKPEGSDETQRKGPPKGGKGPEGAGNRPPPPQDGENESSSQGISAQNLNLTTLEALSSTLQNFDLNNMSTDDQQSLIEQLNSQGILQSGLMIDLSA